MDPIGKQEMIPEVIPTYLPEEETDSLPTNPSFMTPPFSAPAVVPKICCWLQCVFIPTVLALIMIIFYLWKKGRVPTLC